MTPSSLSLDEQRRRAKAELEGKLLEGLRGPRIVLDNAEWDAIEREAQDRFERERGHS